MKVLSINYHNFSQNSNKIEPKFGAYSTKVLTTYGASACKALSNFNRTSLNRPGSLARIMFSKIYSTIQKTIKKVFDNNTILFDECAKIPDIYLIHTSDLLLPHKLKHLKFGDDYILLKHRTDKSTLIKKKGLQCLEDINPELAKSRKGLNYYNDPSLIYFRPITPYAGCKINKNDIVVAVSKNSARIFNQRERDTRNFTNYINSLLTAEEYDNLMSQKPQNSYIRSDKQIVPISYIEDDYIPEICFRDRHIPIIYFVDEEINL